MHHLLKQKKTNKKNEMTNEKRAKFYIQKGVPIVYNNKSVECKNELQKTIEDCILFLKDGYKKQPIICVKNAHTIHNAPAIYFLLKNEKIVYIGESERVKSRVRQHISENKKDFSSIRVFYYYGNEYGLHALESMFIYILNPECNITRVIKNDEDIFYCFKSVFGIKAKRKYTKKSLI